MAQFHDFAEAYLELITAEVPDYAVLQHAVGATAAGTSGAVGRVLDLGTGTGETAASVRSQVPDARVVGVDASPDMLDVASARLGPDADLRCQRLEDDLPDGPFDVVVTAFAVHHLDGPGKHDLFRRVAAVLRPGGRFVLADVVVPEDPADAVTPLDPAEDRPDRLDAQLAWLADAGFETEIVWQRHDLVVVAADRA